MKNIFVLVVLLVTTCVYADQIVSRYGDIVTVVASGEYIMGDSDNRKEARMMALTQAKTNASEVAGTYIESNFESVTKQINGDSIDKVTKQELRSFSAAILQSEITHDNMEMLVNKTTVYKVSIKARIDLATLRERVKQLGEDKAKKDRLIALEIENKDLSSALEKLSRQMRTLENAKSIKPEEIKVLRDERERLLTKIEKNEGAAKFVFEKGSIQNEYERKIAEVDEAIDMIDNNFIKKLSKHAIINVNKPKITSVSDSHYRDNKLDLRQQYDREYLNIHWSISIDKEFSNAMFGFFRTKAASFEDFQKNRFYSQFVALLEKSKIFISLPGITSTYDMTIPIKDGFDNDSDGKCYEKADGIRCYFDGVRVDFYNDNDILLDVSDEVLKKISEIQAEIIYLPYPKSSFCGSAPGFGFTPEPSRVIDEDCRAPSQYQIDDVIVSINAIPIQSDADYVRVIQSTKAGSHVNVEIIRNGKKRLLKTVVVE